MNGLLHAAITRRHMLAGGLGIAMAGPALAVSDPLAAPDYAKAFDLAFSAGFTWPGDDPKMRVPFKVIDGGKVIIASGEIVASDPFVLIEAPAFTQKVPAGSFPVRFAYPMVHGEAGGRVAFARVDFSGATVVSWKMATTPGNDPATLKPGYIFGYPVDAGTGSFYDRQAAAALLEQVKQGKLAEDYYEGWISQGDVEGKKRGMTFYLDVATPAGNIIMFTSGWGDGFYASYFGYDAEGKVASLITDFQVMDWSLDKLPE